MICNENLISLDKVPTNELSLRECANNHPYLVDKGIIDVLGKGTALHINASVKKRKKNTILSAMVVFLVLINKFRTKIRIFQYFLQ